MFDADTGVSMQIH